MPSTDDKLASGLIESATHPGKYITLVGNGDGLPIGAETATRIDDAGSGVTYIGKAAIGSDTADAAWQIKKMTETNGDTTVEYADGNSSFDNVWDNRASLTYS